MVFALPRTHKAAHGVGRGTKRTRLECSLRPYVGKYSIDAISVRLSDVMSLGHFDSSDCIGVFYLASFMSPFIGDDV